MNTREGSDYYDTMMGVDYGPDKILNDSAQEAGLDMQFPWKTRMYLNENYVSVSNGYGAETIFHYPLSNGKWLMTKLSGSDISKVIEFAEGGSPTFETE